jgi:maltooligosyltrehalose trehalohydrolase
VPFPFFCSFGDPELVEAVRRGRREEFAAKGFLWGTEIPDPQSPATFAAAKLRWSWPEGSLHAQLRQLYRDLLAARRQWPALRDRQGMTARVIGNEDPDEPQPTGQPPVLVLKRGGDSGLLAVANLTAESVAFPPLELGSGRLLLSTEDVRYGGNRRADQALERLLPCELAVFGRS